MAVSRLWATATRSAPRVAARRWRLAVVQTASASSAAASGTSGTRSGRGSTGIRALSADVYGNLGQHEVAVAELVPEVAVLEGGVVATGQQLGARARLEEAQMRGGGLVPARDQAI